MLQDNVRREARYLYVYVQRCMGSWSQKGGGGCILGCKGVRIWPWARWVGVGGRRSLFAAVDSLAAEVEGDVLVSDHVSVERKKEKREQGGQQSRKRRWLEPKHGVKKHT